MRQFKNSNNHFIVPLLAVLLCIQISSCDDKGPRTEPWHCPCEDHAVDSCNLTSTVIFIDGSVSMQGYITPSVITNFSAVASAIEGLVPDSCSEYIFKKNNRIFIIFV